MIQCPIEVTLIDERIWSEESRFSYVSIESTSLFVCDTYERLKAYVRSTVFLNRPSRVEIVCRVHCRLNCEGTQSFGVLATGRHPKFLLDSHTSSHIPLNTMRSFCFAALLASACAFTTNVPSVGERVNNVVAEGSAHRTRRATIVMDGKANGEFS